MTFNIVRAAIGLCVIIGVAVVCSKDRASINWRLVGSGLLLQLILGYMMLTVPWMFDGLQVIGRGFSALLSFAGKGGQFVFGGLGRNSFIDPLANHQMGFIFAFQVFPTIIFYSALTAALYYLGILQRVVGAFAWVLARTLRLSGPESVSASANVFLGQTEAPLLVRPFIANMTRSELLCLMTVGMATVTGATMAVYMSMLGGASAAEQVKFATFLLSASIMNVPGAIILSKILLPEDPKHVVDVHCHIDNKKLGANLVDAISNGAADGVKLAANIGAMLIAFIALIALVNSLCGTIGSLTGLNTFIQASTHGVYSGLSLEYLLGRGFQAFAYLIGVDWSESLQVGSLLGTKTVLNEFIAYGQLSQMKAVGSLSDRAIMISTYALCGFSNISSVAILIGGVGSMAPNQKVNLSILGMRGLLGASLACLMSATIAGALL